MNVAEDAIKSLSDLGIDIELSEKKHRDTFLKEEGSDNNAARILVDGLISSIYLKTNEPIKGITPEGEYQLLLGASFVRTHLLLHKLILDGHILDSHCLLRKQLESLARLQELEEKTITALGYKTVPNIKSAIGGTVGKIYGAQSEVAHFTKPEVGHSLLQLCDYKNHRHVTALPVYTKNSVYAMNSRLFLAIEFARWFITKLTKWYPQKNLDILQKQFYISAESSIKAGIIHQPKDG